MPEACIKELIAMSTQSTKRGRAAKLALILIKQKNLKIIHSTHIERADDQLLRLAKKLNASIATIDKELKRRAKREGIETISPSMLRGE